jgi:GNAT superfamily N-acetyltransferase
MFSYKPILLGNEHRKEKLHRYYTTIRNRIYFLVDRGVSILLACFPEDDDSIIGYTAFGHGVVHYTYVKKPYRGQGIALQLLAKSDLVKEDILRVSHWAPLLGELNCKYPDRIKYVGTDVPIVMEEAYGSKVRAG